MILRPFLAALFLALATMSATAQSGGQPADCTPNADGTVPAGCPAGVALDP